MLNMVMKKVTKLYKLCENQDISAFLMYFIVFILMYYIVFIVFFMFVLEEFLSEVYEIN